MKERHWQIKTDTRTYHVFYNGRKLFLDNREVEIPVRTGGRSGSIPVDFQLPMDDVSCWCRFSGFSMKYMELYVNDEIVYDLDNKIYLKEGVRNKRAYEIGLFAGVVVCAILTLYLALRGA